MEIKDAVSEERMKRQRGVRKQREGRRKGGERMVEQSDLLS